MKTNAQFLQNQADALAPDIEVKLERAPGVPSRWNARARGQHEMISQPVLCSIGRTTAETSAFLDGLRYALVIQRSTPKDLR